MDLHNMFCLRHIMDRRMFMVVMVGTVVLMFFLLNSFVSCDEEEESCTANGNKGVCKNIKDCPSALIMIRKRLPPPLCYMDKSTPITCCVDSTVQEPLTRQLPEVTQKKVPSTASSIDEIVFSEQCMPISANRTSKKIGQKAFDKCIEYQEELIYPCQDNLTPSGGMVRGDYCNWKPESLIISGENAYLGEFPHMVLLGYGTTVIEWMCGGTLISEKFVLTAAHCTVSAKSGPVTKMKIGILERTQKAHQNQYDVLNTYRYKEYKSPIVYHDIALLESDKRIQLNRFAVPACLHNGSPINDTEVIVTGWGTTVFRVSAKANILQKVTLTKFSYDECVKSLMYIRHMPDGLDNATQVCYGDKKSTRDTCNGDSGGPAQIKHPKIYCMYSVVGVTSWGRKCGVTNQPGVYIRVAPYLPWIESIVWP